MAYNPEKYQSKNVYLPRGLCRLAEKKAQSQFMNFSVYVRSLIVSDLKKEGINAIAIEP